jgi:hypothetical protein
MMSKWHSAGRVASEVNLRRLSSAVSLPFLSKVKQRVALHYLATELSLLWRQIFDSISIIPNVCLIDI